MNPRAVLDGVVEKPAPVTVVTVKTRKCAVKVGVTGWKDVAINKVLFIFYS